MTRQRCNVCLLPCAVVLSFVVGVAPRAGELPGTEVVRWDRIPIRLTLPLDHERLLVFPAPVQPGVPPSVAQRIRIQAIDDTLYITPTDAFDYERFQVREIESGRIYLLDLKADAGGETHPIRIVASTGDNERALTTDGPPVEGQAPPPSYGYMALTRYAARQVYAPQRLTGGLPGIARVPLKSRHADRRFIRGGAIVAAPLASWRAHNNGASLYVSAVKLSNATREPLVLDPRRLRGEWRAATFQHTVLAPAGDAADTTTVYLISDRPFREALPAWLN